MNDNGCRAKGYYEMENIVRHTFHVEIAALKYHAFERSVQCVVILLYKLVRLVANSSGKVSDEEPFIVADLAMIPQLGLAWQSQSEVLAVGGVHLRREMRVARLWQLGLLVEQMEDAIVLGLDQINTILIVHVDNLLDSEALLLVQHLLFFENALVEELLQLLIAIVDAKLLETIDREVLEACNVQHADVVARRLERDTLIDPVHDIVKQAAVDRFGQGVASVARFVNLTKKKCQNIGLLLGNEMNLYFQRHHNDCAFDASFAGLHDSR